MNWPWRPRRPAVLLVGRYGRCRVPMAELILRHKLSDAGVPQLLKVQSSATHLLPLRLPVDPRGLEILEKQGVSTGPVKVRRFDPRDLEAFDHLLVMDRRTLEHIQGLDVWLDHSRVRLITDYPLRFRWEEVPDPYFSNRDGFLRVYGMLERSLEAFLMDLLTSPDPDGRPGVREGRRFYGLLD